MTIEELFNPSTIHGALIIGVIGGIIVFFITGATMKALKKKKNIQHIKDNHGVINQDVRYYYGKKDE